jgi:predicted nucleotidyltransferase
VLAWPGRNEVHEAVRRWADAQGRRHPSLCAVGYFGSYARGEPSRHSDVDLILVKQTKKRFLDRYDGLLRDLCAALPGLAIDALIYTPEEFEDLRRKRFLARAIQEGKLIYESH